MYKCQSEEFSKKSCQLVARKRHNKFAEKKVKQKQKQKRHVFINSLFEIIEKSINYQMEL